MSGSYRVVVPGSQGTSSYTVVWSYPASVSAGERLNVSATLYVNGLTGLKLFVDTYILSVFVEFPGKGFIGEGNASSFYGCDRPMGCGSPHIYPGGHWGPETISVPLGSSSVPIPQGSSTATVTIGFVTSVWYDAPVSLDYQESGSQVVGNLTVISNGGPAASGSLLSFAGFVAFGGVMGPAVLYLFNRATAPKSPGGKRVLIGRGGNY
jgi:hypothetical protein